MTIKDFDYKGFAENLASQAVELVPKEFNQNEKDYITNTLLNFSTLAGEALYQDQDNFGFNAEQASMITQIIAEWAFHKSVDLIRSGIPQEHWDPIMQKIAFTIFEIAKQTFKQGLPQDQILQLIEHHVKKVYLDNNDVKQVVYRNIGNTNNNVNINVNEKPKNYSVSNTEFSQNNSNNDFVISKANPEKNSTTINYNVNNNDNKENDKINKDDDQKEIKDEPLEEPKEKIEEKITEIRIEKHGEEVPNIEVKEQIKEIQIPAEQKEEKEEKDCKGRKV